MRQKVKRRWFACLWSSFLVLALWSLMSLLGTRSNVSSQSSHLKSSEELRLKLVIVEEHHEVLLAWREAYLNGIISANATVLHIDGHPDDALPTLTKKFPFFRPPKSDEESDHMLQSNDRFMASAKITHLIDRSVWVYPYWMDESLYMDFSFDIGVTKYRGELSFCVCDDMNGSYTCNVNDENEVERINHIPPQLCDIKRKTRTEVIRDVFARTRLPVDKNWLGRDQLIVDIDQDFFGVHLVSSSITAAGIKWKHVTEMSQAISKIMCPLVFQHEGDSDRWFVSVVGAVILHCARDVAIKPSWCSESKTVVQKYFKPFRTDKKYAKLFCQWEKTEEVDFDARRAFLRIWNLLTKYSQEQLRVLRRVGVCLMISLRTLGVEPKLHMCTGLNEMNETAVVEHFPSATELNQQFEKFKIILQHLPTKPRIITVARSSRDGYVPRQLQGQIERRIVDILIEVFKLQADDIIYDPLLMNGLHGDWYNRRYL